MCEELRKAFHSEDYFIKAMIHQTQQIVLNTSTTVEIVNIQSKISQMLITIPLHRSHFFLEILCTIDTS